MITRKQSTKIIIIAIFLLLVFMLSILINITQTQAAEATVDFTAKEPNLALKSILVPVFYISAGVAFLAGLLGSLLAGIAGYVLDFTFILNTRILNNPIIGTGWQVTRDLANLGLVLGIIIIAFATIIRYETYGARQLLWRLIVVALIINFSLTIATVFIDASQILSNSFYSSISGQTEGAANALSLSTRITASLNPQQYLEVAAPAEGGDEDTKGFFGFISKIKEFGEKTMSVFDYDTAATTFTSVATAAIFTFLFAIALFVLTAMLFIRYIILSLLLVLVPLAFLFWIFPKFQNLWTQWWDEFFRWVFFLPAALFFLYLALSIVFGGGDNSNYLSTITSSLNISAEHINPTFTSGLLAKAAKGLTILGFLFIGLVLSHKISGQFSGVAVRTGGFMSNKLTSMARGGAAAAGLGTAGWIKRQSLAAGGKEGQPTYAQRTARVLANVPVIRGLGQRLDIASQAAKERVQKQIDEKSKQSKEYLQSEISSRLKIVPIDKETASAEYITAKKMGVDIPDNLVEKYENAIKATNTANELLQYAPDRAAAFGKNEYEVILELPPSKLTKIMTEGNTKQIETIEKILKSAANKITQNQNLSSNDVKNVSLRRNLERLQNMPSFQAYFEKPSAAKPKTSNLKPEDFIT